MTTNDARIILEETSVHARQVLVVGTTEVSCYITIMSECFLDMSRGSDVLFSEVMADWMSNLAWAYSNNTAKEKISAIRKIVDPISRLIASTFFWDKPDVWTEFISTWSNKMYVMALNWLRAVDGVMVDERHPTIDLQLKQWFGDPKIDRKKWSNAFKVSSPPLVRPFSSEMLTRIAQRLPEGGTMSDRDLCKIRTELLATYGEKVPDVPSKDVVAPVLNAAKQLSDDNLKKLAGKLSDEMRARGIAEPDSVADALRDLTKRLVPETGYDWSTQSEALGLPITAIPRGLPCQGFTREFMHTVLQAASESTKEKYKSLMLAAQYDDAWKLLDQIVIVSFNLLASSDYQLKVVSELASSTYERVLDEIVNKATLDTNTYKIRTIDMDFFRTAIATLNERIDDVRRVCGGRSSAPNIVVCPPAPGPSNILPATKCPAPPPSSHKRGPSVPLPGGPAPKRQCQIDDV